jgi:hypothetical protein
MDSMALAFIASGLSLAVAAQGKDSFTPMPLDAGFGHMDISAPTVPPSRSSRSLPPRKANSRTRSTTTPTAASPACRPSTTTTRSTASGTRWTTSSSTPLAAHREGCLRPGQHSAAGHDVPLRSAGHLSTDIPSSSPLKTSASTTSSMSAAKRSTRSIATSLK